MLDLESAIKRAEEVAEVNQRVIDTGIIFNNVTIDMLYCDDTELIEEHLANYQRCVEEHRQLAEWLKDYKRLKEQEPKTVLYSGDGYADGYMVYDMAEWPNCSYEYEDGDKDWGLPFCPSCGQKLNWESEDEK